MGWFQALKDNSGWLLNSGLSVVADSISAVGTLASSVSGFVFATSFVVDNDVAVSYFVQGSLDAYGKIAMSLTTPINQMNDGFAQGLNEQREFAGEQGFNLTDYLNPDNLRLFAYVTFVGGVALRGLGANMHLWLRARKDQAQFNHLELAMPSWLEHGYQTTGSFIQSIAIVTGSASISGVFYHFMEVGDFKYQYTMPLVGEQYLNETDYQGPLKHHTIKLFYNDEIQRDFAAVQDLGFNIPATSIILNPAINATLDFIYGAGVYIANQGSTSAITLIPLVGAPLIYQGSRFFNNKIENLRLERIRNSNEIDVLEEDSSSSDGFEEALNIEQISLA